MNAIIFSKDRPLQLDATIRSFESCCKDKNSATLFALYATSNDYYAKLYHDLERLYPHIKFIKQINFKSDLIGILNRGQYTLFLVDDNIFTKEFYINEIIKALEKNPDVLGFSLRLGRNINYCYPIDASMNLPEFKKIGLNMLESDWTCAEYDFGYPLEVSSSVYLSEDIIKIVKEREFAAPNSLEESLFQSRNLFINKPMLLYYDTSVAFCNPVNKVQSEVPTNRAGASVLHDPLELAKKFENGHRIDVNRYMGFVSNACHKEVPLYLERNWDVSCKNNDPLISVIVPCYNQAIFLHEAVESVVNQTYDNFEIIIINDGSTDNTIQAAEEIIVKYPAYNIKLITQGNSGPSIARNRGISESKGKYILPLDADDKIHPEMLRKCVEAIMIIGDKKIIYVARQDFGVSNSLIMPPEYNFVTLIFSNQLNYCSLYSKKLWEEVGGYRKNTSGYEDWDFWIAAGLKGYHGHLIPEPLFYYRVKSNSLFTEAVKRHDYLFQQIVCNNKDAYFVKPFDNGVIKIAILNNGDLITESIESIKIFLKKLENSIDNIHIVFKENMDISLLADFFTDINELPVFIQAIDTISGFMQIDLSLSAFDGKTINIYFENIVTILEKIVSAKHNGDYTSIIDILISELKPVLSIWDNILNDIKIRL